MVLTDSGIGDRLYARVGEDSKVPGTSIIDVGRPSSGGLLHDSLVTGQSIQPLSIDLR